jgi:hypothetical protein
LHSCVPSYVKHQFLSFSDRVMKQSNYLPSIFILRACSKPSLVSVPLILHPQETSSMNLILKDPPIIKALVIEFLLVRPVLVPVVKRPLVLVS